MEGKGAGRVSATRQRHGTEMEFCLPQGHESCGQGSHVCRHGESDGGGGSFSATSDFSLLTIASLCCCEFSEHQHTYTHTLIKVIHLFYAAGVCYFLSVKPWLMKQGKCWKGRGYVG